MSYPKIIIDTNKILAAALKPGRVRTILYQAPITPITPVHAIEEIEKHAHQLARKARMSREDFLALIEKLVEDRIILVEINHQYTKEAQRIAGAFDLDDWPFIALALEHQAPIWTNDAQLIKHSLETKAYQALDTQALELHLQGKQGEAKAHLKKKYTTR